MFSLVIITEHVIHVIPIIQFIYAQINKPIIMLKTIKWKIDNYLRSLQKLRVFVCFWVRWVGNSEVIVGCLSMFGMNISLSCCLCATLVETTLIRVAFNLVCRTGSWSTRWKTMYWKKIMQYIHSKNQYDSLWLLITKKPSPKSFQKTTKILKRTTLG
jgi:hypothetical protein